MDGRKIIYTIGHSNKSVAVFVEMLQRYGIETLVDVRTTPYSKYNSQFNREDFRKELNTVGIRYDWRGKNMGGLGDNVDEEATIDEYVYRANNDEVIALCCSEGKPEDCHRFYDLAPKFRDKGLEVQHILWDGTTKKHPSSSPMFPSL